MVAKGRPRKHSTGLPEGLFARERAGKIYYYHTDENGAHIGLGTDIGVAMARLARHLYRKGRREHPPHRLLEWTDVLDQSVSTESYCGIYFLINGHTIVYVGQSKNVIRRIGQHNDKDFDRFAWVLCQPSDLDKLEVAYIAKFNPPLNVMHANRQGITDTTD